MKNKCSHTIRPPLTPLFMAHPPDPYPPKRTAYRAGFTTTTHISKKSKQDLPNNYPNEPQLINSWEYYQTAKHLEHTLFNMIVCTTCKDPQVCAVILGSTWNLEEGIEILKHRFSNLVRADGDESGKFTKCKQSPIENVGQTTPETNSPNSSSGAITTTVESIKVPILFIAETEKYGSEMHRHMREISELNQKMKETMNECMQSECNLFKSSAKLEEAKYRLEEHKSKLIAFSATHQKLSEA